MAGQHPSSHAKDLSRAETAKIRRIVTPKPCSGKLDVPKDIMELWQTDKGRETLKEQWCKAGGMKALLLLAMLHSYKVIFIERVEIISVTTRSKTLTVKGGFYSAADMKSELSYSQFLAYIYRSIDKLNVSPQGSHRQDHEMGHREEASAAPCLTL